MRQALFLFGILAGSLLPVAASAQQAERPSVTIGILLDGPYTRHADLVPRLREELQDLLAVDFDVLVPEDRTLEGDWTPGGVSRALDRLLADPEVDVVVSFGPIASHLAATRPTLPKPTVAPWILDAEIQGLPRDGASSGVTNLAYLAVAHGDRDVEAFQEIAPSRHLAVLAAQELVELIPDLEARAERRVASYGIQVDLIPAGSSAQRALDAIGDGVEAVYILPLLRMDSVEFDKLVEGLIERRLPSYSWTGEREVLEGIMVGRTPETFALRATRRTALHVQRILLGANASELAVDYPIQEDLMINVATARAIGVFPDWRILTEARLIGDDAREGRLLTLEAAVREAIDQNLDLAASDRAVAAGAEEVRLSRSALLPQVDLSATRSVIDEDRAESSLGVLPEKTTTGTARLTQIIYSDPLWADVSIQGAVQEARELDRETISLDIAEGAAVTYLNVLRAQTFERIQKENLRVTRSNLDLSKLRVLVGAASLAEEYRWRNQLANDRQAVVDAVAARRLSELELNRLLNRPLEEPFTTEEADLEGDDLLPHRDRLLPYLDDPWSLDMFRNFMAREALENSPELGAVDALTRGQRRVLASANRAFYIPTFALQADVTNFLDRDFAGSGLGIDGGNLDGLLDREEADDVNWSVGLSVSYPLFSGGSRIAARSQAAEELSKLDIERDAAAARIEQRMRAALLSAGASLINIDLSRDGAEAARKNFELIQDSYGRGVATILDLLDAQRTALVADERAANAVYDFLIDWTSVQRAAGRFDFLSTPEEREAFFQRLDAFFWDSEERGAR